MFWLISLEAQSDLIKNGILVMLLNDDCLEAMQKLIDDKPYLDGIMKKGREKAIYVADSVLSKVYDVVGFSKT